MNDIYSACELQLILSDIHKDVPQNSNNVQKELETSLLNDSISKEFDDVLNYLNDVPDISLEDLLTNDDYLGINGTEDDFFLKESFDDLDTFLDTLERQTNAAQPNNQYNQLSSLQHVPYIQNQIHGGNQAVHIQNYQQLNNFRPAQLSQCNPEKYVFDSSGYASLSSIASGPSSQSYYSGYCSGPSNSGYSTSQSTGSNYPGYSTNQGFNHSGYVTGGTVSYGNAGYTTGQNVSCANAGYATDPTRNIYILPTYPQDFGGVRNSFSRGSYSGFHSGPSSLANGQPKMPELPSQYYGSTKDELSSSITISNKKKGESQRDRQSSGYGTCSSTDSYISAPSQLTPPLFPTDMDEVQKCQPQSQTCPQKSAHTSTPRTKRKNSEYLQLESEWQSIYDNSASNQENKSKKRKITEDDSDHSSHTEKASRRVKDVKRRKIKETSKFYYEMSEEQKDVIRNSKLTSSFGRNGLRLQMWQFFLFLLEDKEAKKFDMGLKWKNREDGTFIVENTKKLAELWGIYQGNDYMTFESMSRNMRHYYSGDECIMVKSSERKAYRYMPKYFKWCEQMERCC